MGIKCITLFSQRSTLFLQRSILSFQEFKILCQCNMHWRFGCIYSWNQYHIFFTVWSEAMIPLYNHQYCKCTTLAFQWENCQKDETGEFIRPYSMHQNGSYWLYLDILLSFTTHMNKYVWNNEKAVHRSMISVFLCIYKVQLWQNP